MLRISNLLTQISFEVDPHDLLTLNFLVGSATQHIHSHPDYTKSSDMHRSERLTSVMALLDFSCLLFRENKDSSITCKQSCCGV
jgi:hypothetical protein